MMGPPLDPWPARDTSGDEAARARVLGSLRTELARRESPRPWRREALGLFAASVALTALVMGGAWALGLTSAAVLGAHAPLLALMWATSAVCAWGALAPRRKGLMRAGGLLALGAAVALVLARSSATHAASSTEWMCTLSHLGMAVVPGLVALVLLRGVAFQPGRALLGGLSVGTTGAFMGELLCGQGWRHVLLYHLSAWAIAALTTLVVSRALPPRSFAP